MKANWTTAVTPLTAVEVAMEEEAAEYDALPVDHPARTPWIPPE